LILHVFVSAQTKADSNAVPVIDALPKADTAVIVLKDSLPVLQTTDSVCKRPWQYSNWDIDPSVSLSHQLLKRHPYFGFGSKPVIVHSGIRQFNGREVLFYSLIVLLLAFALLRKSFPKYFNDLFRLFFRTTLKQKQVREQLMQTPVPSLLLNLYFVVSASLYIDILLRHFNVAPVDNFWLLFLYCAIGLSVIYLVKFIGLKMSGWLFNMKEGADIYIFVVFIINKVIGIFLLPFLVLLAFTQGNIFTVVMVLSWCGVGLLLIYRFLLTYASVRNQVRFNPFHFFLYLCAFEIAPLLLIYKALLFFFQ
jgi:hypothetical protein